MTRVVSPAEVKRQIERDGARHGLRPVFKYGRTMVAQCEHVLATGAIVHAVREEWDGFRDVDMDHPLSNIWRSRKQRHQYNLAKLAMEADARRKQAEDAALEDRQQQRAKELLRAAKQVGFEDFWKGVLETHAGGPIRFAPKILRS